MVSITQVIQGNANISFGVILTMQQALETFIAWPRDMLAVRNNNDIHVFFARVVKRVNMFSISSICLFSMLILIIFKCTFLESKGPKKNIKKTFKVNQSLLLRWVKITGQHSST